MNNQTFAKYELIEIAIKKVEEKAGLVVSKERLQSILKQHNTCQQLLDNYSNPVVLNEVEYESLFFNLFRALGVISNNICSNGLVFENFIKKNCVKDSTCCEIASFFVEWLKEQLGKNKKSLNYGDFIIDSIDKFGATVYPLAVEIVDYYQEYLWGNVYYKKSKFGDIKPIELSQLYDCKNNNSGLGEYFDQRYIDFLSNNLEEIDNIHWRKFEELSAQFFKSNGFDVQLGRGTKDNGTDAILTINKQRTILQCKREKRNVKADMVKILGFNLEHSNFDLGVIFCSHDVTKEGYKVIENYKLKIDVINRNIIVNYLNIYKTTMRD